MKNKNVTIVIGGQAGSCGKGKVSGFLANKYDFKAVTNNWGTNAGHTYINNELKLVLSHLPIGIINSKSQILLNAGAIITPEVLFEEIHKYSKIIGNRKIKIHPNSLVITEKHRQIEKNTIKSGSTFKGCGAASAEKIMRNNPILWKDYYNHIPQAIRDRIEISNTAKILNEIDGDILIEGAQGQDLDINYGLEYPNVTSRMCSASQLLADAGISPFKIKEIIMVIRPYPIRISNHSDNGIFYSGDYNKSEEITWDIIKSRSNAPKNIDLREYTTVTKRLRRVFEMDWERLKHNTVINQPTQIVLNFAEYIDWAIFKSNNKKDITVKIQDFINRIEEKTNVPVKLIGTGADQSDMIEL